MARPKLLPPEPMRKFPTLLYRASALLLISLLASCPVRAAELQAKTLVAWDTYIRFTEQRIHQEMTDNQRFLALDFRAPAETRILRARLQRGQLEISKMQTTAPSGREIKVEDGMIHHWIGAVFIPGAQLDAVMEWVHDYDHHAGRFPEVIASRLVWRQGDTFHIYFRLRRKKIITVYYNTYYTAHYHRHGLRRVFSDSHSTKIAQLEDAETRQEREQPVGDDSGFLWRLNSYWRYEEADGGVYIECESVSLSRNIPFGLGWIIGSYVESVPRESLENTLTSIRDGVEAAMRTK